MKSFDTDIKKYAHKIRLKAAERHELRERVLAYMEYHPLPKQSMKEEIEHIESESFIRIHFNTIYTRIAVSVFAVLLVVIVPFAAERSVPGDVLYSFKTQINEGIRATLANSPYEKIVLETALLERRIAEARLLESQGKLTSEIEAAISETVREHASAVQQSIVDLRSDNTEEAAIAEIAFGSALEVQSAVLEAGISTTSDTTGIADVVREAQADIAAQKATATPSFSGLMARVEIETTRAYELFESINGDASDEERADIERRLEDIARKIAAAQELNANADTMAVSELTSALTLTQKLIAFMTDIDVSENVALETLVPIELTDEERITIANELLTDVLELQSTVLERIDLIVDAALLEKVTFGLDELLGLVNTATSSLEVGDVDSVEQAIATAYEYAIDLNNMTSNVGVIVEESAPETPETPEEEEEDDLSIEVGSTTEAVTE